MLFRVYCSGQNALGDNAYMQLSCSPSELEAFISSGMASGSQLTNGYTSVWRDNYNTFKNNNCDNGYIPLNWQGPIRPQVGIRFQTQGDLNDYLASSLPGRQVNVELQASDNGNVVGYCVCNVIFPTSVSLNTTILINNTCGFICSEGSSLSPASWIGFSGYQECSNNNCEHSLTTGLQHLIEISFTGSRLSQPVNFNYGLGFNNGGQTNVSYSVAPQQQKSFTELDIVNAYFSAGNVRDSGTLKVYGQLEGSGTGDMIDTPNINQEILICQLGFEPCCDDAQTCSITYNDELDRLLGDYTSFSGEITITRFELNGFDDLTNYCCDDVDCDENNFPFEDNSTIIIDNGGGGGGGSDVDLTCVCEGLECICDILSEYLPKLNTALTGINTSLGSINTNLLGVKTSIEHLDGTLEDKDFTITNTINPPVNNFSPVNNITNTVPVPTVTVNTDLSTINSNISYLSNLANLTNLSDLSNLSSLLNLGDLADLGNIASYNNQIAGYTQPLDGTLDDINITLGLLKDSVDNMQMPSIDLSALECDGVSIACILDEIDKKLAVTVPETEEVKTITQIIAEKEIDIEPSNTEVIIEDGMFADVTRKVYEKKITSD